jgi:ABC-2 type transport system ATP-binding protein
MKKINVKNLSKKFKDDYVIQNQSLILTEGIYQLIGSNGVGKSTFLNMLGGIDKSYHGEIIVDRDGMLYLDDKDIGLNAFTIRENIHILMKVFDIKKSKESEKIIEEFYDGRVDANYLTASAGMKMKLGLVLILLRDWDIMLLDESLSAIDTKGRKLIVDKLLEVRDKSTIIFVAHSEIDDRLASIAIPIEMKKGELNVKK